MAGDTKLLGNRIRDARQKARITQADLATRVGVVESYISTIETGRMPYTPSADTLRLIASVLKIDHLELLELAEKTPAEIAPAMKNEAARGVYSLLGDERLTSRDWQDLERFLRRRLERVR